LLIPEHKIEEVLERVDLVQLVSRHVELKKSGRSFKGRCPFHQEKSASFHVTPEMKRFKCFGCQAGGDAIAFIQRFLGKSFVDAVKDLAREVGVDLEAAADPSARERQELKEVTDLATEHFRARLWDPVKGKVPREYLAKRGVPEETIRAFGLGYAPNAWTELADELVRHGMIEWGVKAGLVARRTRGEGFYDVFRGRLIIPIRAPEGRSIAFGARLLEATEGPKYLNSRESKLYNKSETLYGLDQAREEIRRQKTAVLVEGYFDCIGLHQVGVKNAVALCSTALTPGHMGVLTRAEAKELVLLLDGDDAGRKAVERLAGALLAAGTATRVALLPEGEDPDTFAQRVKLEGVQALLASARPLTEHLFATLLPAGKASSFEQKMQALGRMKPIAASLSVGLVRSAFFGAMSGHFGLPAAELETELRGKAPPLKPAPKPGEAATSAGGVPGARPAAPPRVERPPDALEAYFAASVLKQPRLLQKDTFRIQDEILHAGLRGVIAAVTAGRSAEDAAYDSSQSVKTALETALRHVPADPGLAEQAFVAACRKLKLRRIDEQLSHIARLTGQQLGAAELDEETKKLQAERVDLLALRRRVIQEPVNGEAGTKGPTPPV
jgi:DNA primase